MGSNLTGPKYLVSNVYYFKECLYATQHSLDVLEKDSLETWKARALRFLEVLQQVETRIRARVRERYGILGLRLIEDDAFNLERWAQGMSDRLQGFGAAPASPRAGVPGEREAG